jgi:hypothetical protein
MKDLYEFKKLLKTILDPEARDEALYFAAGSWAGGCGYRAS